VQCGVATREQYLDGSFAASEQLTRQAPRCRLSSRIRAHPACLMTALRDDHWNRCRCVGSAKAVNKTRLLPRAVIGGLIFATFARFSLCPAFFHDHDAGRGDRGSGMLSPESA